MTAALRSLSRLLAHPLLALALAALLPWAAAVGRADRPAPAKQPAGAAGHADAAVLPSATANAALQEPALQVAGGPGRQSPRSPDTGAQAGSAR